MKSVFIETPSSASLRRAVSLAEDTEKGLPGMVAVWGEAGTGKTQAAQKLYADRGYYVRAMEGMSQFAFLQELCFEITGARHKSSHACKIEIIKSLEEAPQTVFLDEADRLDIRRLEDLRDIHDMTGSPIVLIGEQGLPAKLNTRTRIMGRIPKEFQITFNTLDVQTVALYVFESTGMKISPEACEMIRKETKGNFRMTHNLVLSLEQGAKAQNRKEMDEAFVISIIESKGEKRRKV